MPLQDLTPQLRTRLSRMERAVGWFVLVATALLVFAFGYYVYNRAKAKGWFTPKFNYQTWLNSSEGLKVGDPVKLMGATAGEITDIIPNAPNDYYGLTVNFTILKPHYGYIWDDSKVKVSSDFLGNRFLEITKGVAGLPTIDEDTNHLPIALLNWRMARKFRPMVLEETRKAHPDMERTNRPAFNWFLTDAFKNAAAADRAEYYTNLTEIYGLEPQESPALNDRLERLANQIETALPNVLDLTNKITLTLQTASQLASNLNVVAVNVLPVTEDLRQITAHLNQPGALGEWLLPTNINQKLDAALARADKTLDTANTNLAALAQNLNRSLENLSDITSNLSGQVQANTNILSGLSQAIIDADNLVQGLKRHWFFRSAFKKDRANAKVEKK